MKKKKRKPDDYFNNGAVELVRDGTMVSMRNLLSESEINERMELLAKEYENEKKKISDLVNKIRVEVIKCDPIELLKFSKQVPLLSSFNKISEIEYSKNEIYTMRCTEYIQCIFASTGIPTAGEAGLVNENLYHGIINNIADLYERIEFFYFYWSAYADKVLGIESELLEYIVESQMLWLVRGNTYQVFQVGNLEKLLLIHDDKFIELFGIGAKEIINGIAAIEYSLSSGMPDAIADLMSLFDKFKSFTENNPDYNSLEEFVESSRSETEKPLYSVFGTELYEVSSITSWPDSFVNELAFEIGEEATFFNSEFPGWPIMDLPTQKRPFIKYEDKVYCFDYYSFFDNIYRVIQKMIMRLDHSYTTTWSQRQQLASEMLVEEVVQELIPNALIYRDNYYPKNTSLKHCAENDLIAIYDNTLLIIEVKAGSFTYTPPITDYRAHIKSFKTLLEKADYQCERTYNYIVEREVPIFYNREKEEKFSIDKSLIENIYTLSITVDNFNEFEAKAEKLSFINLMAGSIAISLDDLRLYANYFENSLMFLHFLKERKAATKSKILTLSDELDHLGMYIKHNMYTLNLDNEIENTKLSSYGYREALDKYFGTLHIEQIQSEKPIQEIPKILKEILDFLEKSNIKNKSFLSNYLLDFADEARNEFCNGVTGLLARQRHLNRMVQIVTFGELKYTLFVHQPDIKAISQEMKDDYNFGTVFKNEESKRISIDLYYDLNMDLVDVKFKVYKYVDINEEDKERYTKLGDKYAKTRAISYKKQTGKKKIGRNDPCPCGSGKKYKKCCIGVF